MSLESNRSRNDPLIAERIKKFKDLHSQGKDESETELPKTPIEEVAMNYLKELNALKKEVKRDRKIDSDHPLIGAVGNVIFIRDILHSENLQELITRTQSAISLNRNGSLYYGRLFEAEDEDPEDDISTEVFDDNFNIWYDNRVDTFSLRDADSLQKAWDRSNKEGRSEIAYFGRMTKKAIIEKFEAFAKDQSRLFY